MWYSIELIRNQRAHDGPGMGPVSKGKPSRAPENWTLSSLQKYTSEGLLGGFVLFCFLLVCFSISQTGGILTAEKVRIISHYSGSHF